MKKSTESFEKANILIAEVGTTGFMGGDAGHGGQTYLKLTDDAATSWSVSISDEKNEEGYIEQPHTVTISVQGDTELRTFAESLEWAAKEIKKLANID